MKVMLLAAGEGQRLRPLTDQVPKPLLRAGGQMLIERWLQTFLDAGFREFVINTWHLEDKLIAALGDGADRGISIEYSREPFLLETGGGITRALSLLGEDDFVVVSSDIASDFDPLGLPTSLGDSLAHLVMVDNPAHHPKGDFVLDPEGRIRFEDDGERLTYSGIGLFSPALFDNAPEGSFKLRVLLDWAIEQGRMTGQYHDGFWIDVGTKARYETLIRHYRKKHDHKSDQKNDRENANEDDATN